MDFIENANAIVALISAVVGLISAGLPLGIVIYNLFKGKNKKEVFETLKDIATAAIVSAEASGKAGADKKTMVIEAVKAGAAAKGIDVTPFLTQLDAFIEQAVATNNAFKNAKQ